MKKIALEKIAFIGLGVMGYPMAGHLTQRLPQRAPGQSEPDICVWNRSVEKAQAWGRQYGGTVCSTIADAVADADVVLCCLGNDDDVRQVLCGVAGQGAIARMKAGSILMDHTTTSAALAEELARLCQQQGIHFVDAPVSGGQSGAENGQLTIMCGGERQIFAQLQEQVFPAYGKSATYMGPHGQGQRAKMVNQICISGVLRGLSEGLLLAQKAGLDIPTLIDCLKHGAAGSWQMENRAVTMAEGRYDFGFAIEWMAKDLGYALQEAQRNGLQLPLAAESLEQYRQLIASGHGREDSSSIHRSVTELALK